MASIFMERYLGFVDKIYQDLVVLQSNQFLKKSLNFNLLITGDQKYYLLISFGASYLENSIFSCISNTGNQLDESLQFARFKIATSKSNIAHVFQLLGLEKLIKGLKNYPTEQQVNSILRALIGT